MHATIGRIAVWLGVALVAVGMIVGFGAMIIEPGSFLVRAIGLVPLGFIFLLTGIVIGLLHRPE